MQDIQDYLSIFDNEENFLNEFLRIGKRVVKIAKKKYPLQYEDFIDTLALYVTFNENEDLYSIGKNTNEFCHELFDSLENIDYKSKNELDLFTTKWSQELQNRNDKGVEIIDHIIEIVNYTSSKNDLELEKFFLDTESSSRIGKDLKERLLPFYKGNMFSEKLIDKLLTFVNLNPLFCAFIYYELSLELTKNCVTPVFERYKRIYEKDTGIIPCGNEFLTFIQNNYPVHCLDGSSIKQMLSEYMDFEVISHYSLPKNRKYKKQTIDITPHQTLSIETTTANVEESKKVEKKKRCIFNSLQIAIAVTMVNQKTVLFPKTISKTDSVGTKKFLKDIEEKFKFENAPNRFFTEYLKKLNCNKEYLQNLSEPDKQGVKRILELGGYTELLKDIK